MAVHLPVEGTRRLRLSLALGAASALAAALAVVLILYGAPYWYGWWIVMAALLALSFPASYVAARVIEWVIAGYRTS